jgi:CBS domain-containing protein
MKVSDCMTAHVRLCSTNDTVQDAARTMKEMDVGLLPVGENDRLVGTITERDIVTRVIAGGLSLDTPVKEAMSPGIAYCFDTDTVKTAAEKMAELQIRRLPVLNEQKRLVGIVSLGDIAKAEQSHGGKALKGISKTAVGGAHHAAH